MVKFCGLEFGQEMMGPSEKLNLDTCKFNHEVGENTCIDWLFDKTKNPQKTQLHRMKKYYKEIVEDLDELKGTKELLESHVQRLLETEEEIREEYEGLVKQIEG